MMSNYFARLTSECDKKLEMFVKKKGFKSRSECVEKMIDFFIENAIDPSSSLNLNLQSSLSKINDDFLKRDDSFRKWFGHLKNKTITLILKQQEQLIEQNEEIKKMLLNSFVEQIVEEVKQDIKPLNDTANEDKKDDNLENEIFLKYDKVIESKEEIIKELKTKLGIIISKSKEEKTTFGKPKIVIELSPVEFENLKQY